MRLPNFLEDQGLNELRFVMGAAQVGEFSVKNRGLLITREELVALETQGIDVTAEGIDFRPDGTLAFKGVRVLVYIRDIANYWGSSGDGRLPRFHFAACRTLIEMKEKDRFAKYVVANRDDGYFQVNRINSGQVAPSLQELAVCQNCLDRLRYNGFSFGLPRSQRHVHVRSFQLAQFFEAYPRDLIGDVPKHSSDTQPLNDYTSDWAVVSEGYKKAIGYRCERCELQPSARYFLHVHHKDGLKCNNGRDNLECLCLGCHAREHPHLRQTAAFHRFQKAFPGFAG